MNLNLVFASEFIKMEVDQGLKFLQTTWLQQPSSAQFREQLQQVILYALKNKISKTLFDVRARAYLEIADQNWLVREIVPMFKDQPLWFAYVISPATLATLDIHRIQSAVESDTTDEKKMQMKMFLNKEEALEWLMEF